MGKANSLNGYVTQPDCLIVLALIWQTGA